MNRGTSQKALNKAHPPSVCSTSGVVTVARVKLLATPRARPRDTILQFLHADFPTDAHRLAATCRALLDDRLLEITDSRGSVVSITDIEAGAFELPLRDDPALGTRHLRVLAERASTVAREALLRAFRGLLKTPADDRFVHEAMYLGRVEQVRVESGRGTWRAALREGERLSEWLLAVLAADVWTYPQLYRSGLSVCDACDEVNLDLAYPRRDRCLRHVSVPDEDLFDARDLPTRPDIQRELTSIDMKGTAAPPPPFESDGGA